MSSIPTWSLKSGVLPRRRTPGLMGIVNVTPDSFSDGGRFFHSDAAVDCGLRLVDEGADILDVGGESTRPGALPVSTLEELRRVIPVVRTLVERTTVPVSIDTTKAAVAREALAAGAAIVNDISGLTFDPEMPDVCAAAGCGVIAMHIQGTPQTMQANPVYADVVAEVVAWLRSRLDDLVARGVREERIVLDPGIGFGKTAEHNLQLLSHVGALRAIGRPVLIGHSRKRFLKRILNRPIDEPAAGTIGVALALAEQEVDLLRVHDVRAVQDALLAWDAVRSATADPRDS